MYIFQKTVEWQSKTFCFLAFKIFESDKEGSVSIKLQRIMVRRSDLCEQITNFSSHLYRKSLSNIEFYSDRISKASTPAVNIWIFRVERGGRWEVVRTRASQINLPPPELQQFYSCEPQHLGISTELRSEVIPSHSASSWLWHYIVYIEYHDDIAPKAPLTSDLSLTNSEERLEDKHWHGVF